MTRFHSLIALVACALLPLDAAAFWLADDSQCFVTEEQASWEFGEVGELSEPLEDGDCEGPLDPSDPSFNACFELADGPVSTLPELIAQEQAQRVVEALLDTTGEFGDEEPLIPSPDEASVSPEHERQIVVKIPRPRPKPNSCSVYPDNCENAPYTPTLNLEGSVAQADCPSADLDVPPPILPEMRRGPPNEGVAAAPGIVSRLDRPPQAG